MGTSVLQVQLDWITRTQAEPVPSYTLRSLLYVIVVSESETRDQRKNKEMCQLKKKLKIHRHGDGNATLLSWMPVS